MVELWVPITIAAAFLQCVRTAIQKRLKTDLSTNGAGFTRFVYGFPLALVYVAGLHYGADLALPEPNWQFLMYCAIGGLAQIVATSLLIWVFSFRNFAVGTVYSKTEAVQTALIGIVLLGEPLSFGGAVAIFVSLIGVMLLSMNATGTGLRPVLLGWTEKAALIGIASGGLFGLSAVTIRAASLSLEQDNFVMPAAYTLAVIICFQTIVLGLYLCLREPAQLRKVVATWRVSSLVGITGVIGSAGWFAAMTIQNAAYVRTLGQVELVFTFLASYLIFRERSRGSEIAGIVLIVIGVIVLLNFR